MTSLAQADRVETNRMLGQLSADARILWAAQVFGDKLVLLSSMQKTAVVLMHTFCRLGLSNEVPATSTSAMAAGSELAMQRHPRSCFGDGKPLAGFDHNGSRNHRRCIQEQVLEPLWE